MNQITMKLQADHLILEALKEDISSEDVTTNSVMKEAVAGEVDLICKQDGIIAGLEVFERVFTLLDPDTKAELYCKDGEEVKNGQLMGKVKGDIRVLLSGERVALNYLQRMSGIATYTNSVAKLLEGSKIKLLDTRKTTPNMRIFEKYAVRAGGGYNHRYNLSDGVLLKDNHIGAAGSVTKAVQMAKEYAPFVRKIEVEVENLDMVKEAVEAGADIIMLDNMSPEDMKKAVEEEVKSQRMKTELITNVSHDLKTPLTSIINYVDLLKRENLTDPQVQEYLRILDEKSQRLKVLTEDVVEASKASTGNIKFEMNDIDFVEMVQQVIGEFEEKFQEKNLTMMVHFTDEPSMIYADGQKMWRVLENVFGNVVKYAMEGTRVYAEISNSNKKVVFSLKNISAQPLNFSADELTERFIRGDVARNTEGSGLGLSIAKSLTELQGGEFKLYLDGDLFKVMITFAANMSKK